MGSLIGIEKNINGKLKFLGKVGYSKELKETVYYRQASSRDAILQASQCLGYDTDAVDEAIKRGATLLVTYCTDTGDRLITPAEVTQVESIRCQDMGEELQYRLPLREPYIKKTKGKLNIGYTSKKITL